MNRRGFLKALLGAIGIAVLPKKKEYFIGVDTAIGADATVIEMRKTVDEVLNWHEQGKWYGIEGTIITGNTQKPSEFVAAFKKFQEKYNQEQRTRIALSILES